MWNRFQSRVKEGVESSYRFLRPNIRFVAVFGIVTHPAYYLYLQYAGRGEHDSLILRSMAVMLVVPCLFYRTAELSRFGKWFPTYTFLVIAFVLPFFFSFLFLLNASYAESRPEVNTWQMQYIFALVATVLFTYDRLILVLIVIVSNVSAILINVAIHDLISNPIVFEMYFQQIPFFLFMVAAGIYFNRTREVVHQEKLRVAGSIGGTIAHELRTPLLSIRTRSEGIAHYLPALVDAYRTATRENTSSQLPEKKLQLLEEALDDINRDVDYANTVIDMLLISSRTDLSSNFLSERVSALEVAKQSIERYPFANSKERDMVVLGPCEDFMIFGPSVLIVHVLFNLVKNALYYVQRAGEGTVEIGVDGSANTIYVLDSGPGIPPENRRKIFDRFYSTTDGAYGSGIGLSFCRQVVEDLGGKIVCDLLPELSFREVVPLSSQL